MPITLKPNHRPDIAFLISLLIALAVILFLSSCSCDYHYSRLAKKCELKKDTLIIHDTVETKPIIASGSFSVTNEGLDSLNIIIAQIVTQNDSTVKSKDSLIKELQRKIGTRYLNKKCLTDTAKVYTHGGFIKIWQNNLGRIEWQINIPAQKIPRAIKVDCGDKIIVVQDYYPNWLKWSVITMLLLIIVGFVLKKLT
jgi:hypothetical protein